MPPRTIKSKAAAGAASAAASAAGPSSKRRRSRAARDDDDDGDEEDEEQHDSDEGEAEYDAPSAAAAAAAEKKRRSRGPEPREREGAGAAAGAAAGRGSARLSLNAASAAAAAVAPASSASVAAAAAAACSEGVASMQALQRFFAARGRASQKRVEQVWERIKQKCESPASKVIPLETAFVNLNLQLRFLELEVRRCKSEVDEQVYWVLVDQTERVAVANAKRNAAATAAAAAAAAGDDDEEKAAAPAAAASSSSSGKKGAAAADAGEMAKFLNPSLFSEAQILYYKALLDAILASPNGQLSHSSALDERAHIVAEGAGSAAARRKLVLSPANAATTLGVLCEQGWLRALGPELAKFAALSARPLSKKDAAAAAAAAAAASSDSDAVYALGERAYAELRKYIESKAEGKPKCKLCGHPCTMCLTCVQQSTASARAAASNDLAAAAPCSIRLHYSCARSWFVERKQTACPDKDGCGCEWDRYALANAK